MSPFSCSACRGGLLRISFFRRVFTLFLSVFSRLDEERGTAEGQKEEVDEEEDREDEDEWVSAERSAMGLESRWEGMVVRMKSGRAGWRRRWDSTDWGIICHGGRVKIYVGWMEERMEERMEGCKRPVWTFEEKERWVAGRVLWDGRVKWWSQNGPKRGSVWWRLTRFSPLILISTVVQHLHAARSPQRIQKNVV